MKRLVLTLLLAVLVTTGVLAPFQATAQNVACYGEQGGAKRVAGDGCEYEFQSGSTLDVQAGASVDFGVTPQFGSNNLYPLGYASTGQEIVCGTTSTFTGSTTINVTSLTTATYVLATQVTAPITTAAYLHASDPTTSSITLTSLNNTFGAGTTGIAAHYCVVGDQ